MYRPRLRCFVVVFALLASCASTPPGLTFDGGAPRADGGAPADGGARPDGGALPDGGPAVDGGPRADGGSVDGGLAADGGAQCPSVTVIPAQTTSGVDCDQTLDEATIRAQVCAGTRIAAGLYDETGAPHEREWEEEGDGSGHMILGCATSAQTARELIESQHPATTLTGCSAETADYYSFEVGAGSSSPHLFFRVNQCSRWPYILASPNTIEGALGQIGPHGVTIDEGLAAHIGQYLWYVDRDSRPTVFLVGARPVVGGVGPGTALCEAELAGATILVRKVTFLVMAGLRTISRAVQAKASFAANCN